MFEPGFAVAMGAGAVCVGGLVPGRWRMARVRWYVGVRCEGWHACVSPFSAAAGRSHRSVGGGFISHEGFLSLREGVEGCTFYAFFDPVPWILLCAWPAVAEVCEPWQSRVFGLDGGGLGEGGNVQWVDFSVLGFCWCGGHVGTYVGVAVVCAVEP
jgi:hypothetical protein